MSWRGTEAQAQGINAQAQSVCAVSEDIEAARRAWRSALDGAAEAFKLEDATSAFENVREVWEDEFRVYAEVLQQWCKAAQAAAAGYQTVDAYEADRQASVMHGRVM